MKRITAILTVIAIIMAFSPMVFAASQTYFIPELKVSIDIPDKYIILTQNTPADDPAFDLMSMSYSEIMQLYKDRSIYLNAMTTDGDEEIVVTMSKNEIDYFNNYSDDMLEDTAESFLENGHPGAPGATVKSSKVYNHPESKFIVVRFYNPSTGSEAIQYYTIYNNKAMNFTIHSYDGSISSEQESIIKAAVDSIEFSGAYVPPTKPATQPATEAPTVPGYSNTPSSFVYNDDETGVSFTVPEGWEKEDLSDEDEYINVQLTNSDWPVNIIAYSNTDLWSEISEEDKTGYSRSNINNTFFAYDDIKEMTGDFGSKITEVTYNGIEYYQVDCKVSETISGTDISSPMIILLYFENGWQHMFHFSGSNTDKAYDDFVEILNSVQYPGTETNLSPDIDDSSSFDTYVMIGAAVVALFVIAIIAVIIIVVVSRKKKAKTPPSYQMPQQPYQAPQQPYQAPQQPYQAPQQPYQAPQQNYNNPQNPNGQ